MSFQDVDRKPTLPTSPRMRRNHPPKLPRVKAIPFSPPSSNNRITDRFGSGSRWKQVVNGGRYERVQSSSRGNPSYDSPKHRNDKIIDPDELSMSQSDESSFQEDDSNIDSRDDSESFGPDRYQSREEKKSSSSYQIRLQQKELEATRRSNFAILTYEMQQYQKLVSDLEHLLKDAGESPDAAWRANILVKSVEETDIGLLEKLDKYEKMLEESSSCERGSMNQQKTDLRLAQQRTACSKLRRDYNRCHATMKSGIEVHRKRQTVEASQLGAVHWNENGTGAPTHQSDVDFFDRAMRQKELERINTSMREVHDIYHGLAGLVERQQEQIDDMEDNASYSAANIKRGTDEYICYSKKQNDIMCGALNGCGDDDDVAITMSYDLPPDGLRVSENFYWSMPLETMTQDLRSVKNDILAMGKDLIGVGKRFDCGAD
jgi:hypothetical protein